LEKLSVIKIGGNIIDDETQLSSFLKEFAAIEGKKILIHGGGKLATRVAEAMGISQEMVNGRRITDAETLKVVTMVYAGFINKNIVAKLQSAGCNAVGLSGADGNIIKARKRTATTIDYGFAGDIDEVNSGFIGQLLSKDAALVFSPITHNGNGQLLNTNADTIAQEIAKAMSTFYEITLVYCFEKKGVLLDPEDDDSIIPVIDKLYFEKLKEDLVISAGMIPKLDNAFEALSAGVKHIFIGHAAELPQLILHQSGTSIVHE